MKINKQARREAKHLFKACCTENILDEAKVRQVVTAVLTSKPRGYLAILSHFQRLVKLDVERRTARVESAVAITPDLQERVRQSLTKVYGAGLDISFGQDPGLIGGLRVKVGSDVYDGSVRAKLAALQESFG